MLLALQSLARFVAGRRGKFVVLGVWVVAFVALTPLGSKLADETQDDTASFLPESAESTEVVNILDEDFESGETTQGLIVYQRDGGLTEADKQRAKWHGLFFRKQTPGRFMMRAGSPGTSRTAKKVTVTTPKMTNTIWAVRRPT